jgi:hypothetical protein
LQIIHRNESIVTAQVNLKIGPILQFSAKAAILAELYGSSFLRQEVASIFRWGRKALASLT